MAGGHAHDSYTGIFVDILLNGQELKSTEYFQSLEIVMGVGKAWTGTLSLFDAEGDFLDNLIFSSGYHSSVDITFGLSTDPTSHGTYHGSILSATPEFSLEGTTLEIQLITKPMVGSLLKRENYHFKENMKVSAIVKEICSKEGWDTTDPHSNNTIEETKDALEFPLSANGESAYKFIKETLLPQAVNTKGKGGYKAFFDRKGGFHFHTPDFAHANEKHYTFARNASGVVVSFAPTDTGVFASLLGGGNASVEGVDARKGASTQNTADSATGVDNAGHTTFDGATATKSGAAGVAHRELVVARTEKETERRAKSMHDTATELFYSAELMVHGTHEIEILDFVVVDYIKKDGGKHFLSGRFKVFGLTQTVGQEGWETKMELHRGGVSSVVGSTPHKSSSHSAPSGDTGSNSHSVEVH
jgi:hypothetical protein